MQYVASLPLRLHVRESAVYTYAIMMVSTFANRIRYVHFLDFACLHIIARVNTRMRMNAHTRTHAYLQQFQATQRNVRTPRTH